MLGVIFTPLAASSYSKIDSEGSEGVNVSLVRKACVVLAKEILKKNKSSKSESGHILE